MTHQHNGYTITTDLTDNTVHIWKIINSKAYATTIEILPTSSVSEYKALIESYCKDEIFTRIALLTKEVL